MPIYGLENVNDTYRMFQIKWALKNCKLFIGHAYLATDSASSKVLKILRKYDVKYYVITLNIT